jgi:hypothetical protein
MPDPRPPAQLNIMPSHSIIIPTKRFGRHLDPCIDASGCAFPGRGAPLCRCLRGRGWRRFLDSFGGFPDRPLSEDAD